MDKWSGPRLGMASGLFVILASCGATQGSPSSAAESTESEPTRAIVSAPAPSEQAVVVAAAKEIAAPVKPGKLVTYRLARAIDGDTKRILSKQCREIYGQCDPSTITLAIDGTPIAFRPKGTPSTAPFGDWDYLDYRSDGKKSELRMEFGDDYEYLQVSWKGNSFEAFEAKQWPKTLEGVLLESSDWDGDGTPEAIHYRCKAFAVGDTPTDCLEAVIYSGEKEIPLVDNDTISTNIVATALPGNALRIVTEPLEDDDNVRSIQIMKMQDGKVVPVWDAYTYGKLKWNKDKSWSLTSSMCQRAATFDYDDDTDKETLVRFGRENFVRTRYTWDGETVKTKIQKRWNDDKSRCQSQGRCPYVYAGASQMKLGEILKDQVGTKNWRNEFIEVPRSLVDGGELLIRIAEEKPDEMTYLDDVWLQVGQQKLRPLSCPEAVCGSDRVTMTLAPGEDIELRFVGVPAAGEIRLFANGYYRYLR